MTDLSGPLLRKNHGRGHSYHFGSQKVPGATTVLQSLPKPALKIWAAGVAADFVADHIIERDGHLIADEMWAELVEQSKNWRYPLPAKFSRTKLADSLKWLHNQRSTEAAARGTEIHDLAEQLAAGVEVDVPEHLVGHVDSYLKFRDAYNPRDELTEVSVGYRGFGGYAGTLDLIATIDHPELGEVRALIDYKTSGSGIFGETALQLAAYRFAEVMLDEDGNEQPMEPTDWCGALWLRADGFDLYPMRADEEVHRVFLYLRQVWNLTERLSDKEKELGDDGLRAVGRHLQLDRLKGDALRLVKP
jgi:hypothetical protein